MNAGYARLRARYLALARRERGLLAGALLVLVVGIGYLAGIEPALRQRALLERQIAQQQHDREALQPHLGAAARDPNAALREQLEALMQQLRSTDHEFRDLQNGLVQPQHMGALLQSLLTEQPGLRLIGLRSLPVTAIGDATIGAPRKPVASHDKASDKASAAPVAASAPAGGEDAWLYRHAVEVRVQGSYADMLAYLRAIENLPRHVRWGDVEIDARQYPANVMSITLYTVSLEKSWWVL